jgi:hypothetical protein
VRQMPQTAPQGAPSAAHAILFGARDCPGAVDESVIDSVLDYRRATTALAADAAARRSLARYWNDRVRTVPGWPSQLLIEPASRRAEAFPPWDAYPIGLRYEIEAYLEGLTRVRKAAKGKRVAPAKATTIRVRRARSGAANGDADRHRHGGDDLAFLHSRSRRQPARP